MSNLYFKGLHLVNTTKVGGSRRIGSTPCEIKVAQEWIVRSMNLEAAELLSNRSTTRARRLIHLRRHMGKELCSVVDSLVFG